MIIINKDIKTRDTVKSIKTKDSKGNLAYFIKEETISIKEKSVAKKSEPAERNNAQVHATNQTVHSAEATSIQTVHRARHFVKHHHNKRMPYDKHTNSIRVSKEVKTPKYIPNHKSFLNTEYITQMKTYFTKKQRIKIKKTTILPIKTIKQLSITLRTTINIIKKGLFTVNHLFSYGMTIIILVVLTLYIGAFSAFSDNSIYAYSFIQLSEEVIAYTPVIEEYAEKYGIGDFVPLIQAIMMQESQGLGNDPMDSSHFEHNTQYPNGITDAEYSIEIGIHYLAECLNQAAVSSTTDTKPIYLAIQGYDFGKEYINWASNHFGGYSSTNAQLYAEHMKTNLNLSTYGNPKYVEQVLQYIDFGFGTFRLQPNFENHMAWGNNNPYSKNKLYGQCTWFAWGRFYELYGYSPGFTGDGWNCAKQLVNSHPDLFELSSNPQVGAIFSCIGTNHVGIVVGWDGTNITIQEGNLDGKTNTFNQAKSDWQTVTYELNEFRRICDGVVFANKKLNLTIPQKLPSKPFD